MGAFAQNRLDSVACIPIAPGTFHPLNPKTSSGPNSAGCEKNGGRQAPLPQSWESARVCIPPTVIEGDDALRFRRRVVSFCASQKGVERNHFESSLQVRQQVKICFIEDHHAFEGIRSLLLGFCEHAM